MKLRKVSILFAVIAICSIGSLSAQIPFLKLGVKTSWNTTSTEISNVKDLYPTNSSGFNIGAWARVSRKKMFIQPELVYASKSSTIKQTFEIEDLLTETTESKIKLKTVDLPILIGYQLIDGKLAKINIITGPVASFDTGSEVKNITAAVEDIADFKFDNAKWGYQLGVGSDFGPLTFDIRYEWDISGFDINDPADVDNVTFESKSNVFTVGVGFTFL